MAAHSTSGRRSDSAPSWHRVFGVNYHKFCAYGCIIRVADMQAQQSSEHVARPTRNPTSSIWPRSAQARFLGLSGAERAAASGCHPGRLGSEEDRAAEERARSRRPGPGPEAHSFGCDGSGGCPKTHMRWRVPQGTHARGGVMKRPWWPEIGLGFPSVCEGPRWFIVRMVMMSDQLISAGCCTWNQD